MKWYVVAILAVSMLSGCLSTGRYSQRHDSAPVRPPSNITQHDAIPVHEPYNPANSRSYTVLGKRYHPMASSKGYEAEGEASWYGQKFHGHLTANGETYDMYQMSAAHKTLPIPSYVRVTNTENNRSVVVRVNDRGPFHGHRLIDLSYAAALKLDILKTGTAHVKIAVIHVDQVGNITVGKGPTQSPEQFIAATSQPSGPSALASTSASTIASTTIATNKTVAEDAIATGNVITAEIDSTMTNRLTTANNSQHHSIDSGATNTTNPNGVSNTGTAPQMFIQVAALQSQSKIAELAKGLEVLLQIPTQTPEKDGIFRLQLGPLSDEIQADGLLNELRAKGYDGAYKLYQ